MKGKEKQASKKVRTGSPKKSATKASGKSVQPQAVKLDRPKLPKRRKEEIDDPSRRFRELFADRQFGSRPTEKLADRRLAAIDESRRIAPLHETNLTPATPGGSNWVELGPTAVPNGQTYGGSRVLVSGRITEIVQDPLAASIIYASAARGGVWKTTDGGQTWTPMSDNTESLAIGALAISKSNPKVLYAGTGEGDIYYYRLIADLNSVNAAYEGVGVLKTIDGGTTWTLQGQAQFTGACFYKMAVHPSNEKIAFGATNLGLYRTTNGGTWTSVAAATGVVEIYGAYTSNLFVDISTPDIVYISGVEIYKATRSGGTWTVTNVGGAIHPDNHAFAGHPTDHLIVYAGSDGGIYKSKNGGGAWDDSINEGIGIMQFEFLGQHPTSDAEAIAGTQDNGTQMFRNHRAFYHSADGDGGQAGIDATSPNNVIHTYYNASPERSTQGGKFGSYVPISGGLVGGSLFYPPFAFDDTNSQNLAFGTDRVNLDAAQGTGGWPSQVSLSGGTLAWTNISGTAPNAVPDVPCNSLVIDPLNATHFYVGTDIGVFRTTNSGTTWQLFNDGLPNTAVYDLRLQATTRLLRAATHGRGLWERRIDLASMQNVDVYFRDHLMSTARIIPAPSPVSATFDDPLQHVNLSDQLYWWQCADIKVDATDAGNNFQMPVASVDYLAFETRLEHRDPHRGKMNRVYVQVHNRGITAASNVTVKLLFADASPGLPNLPSDFWTAFPGDGNQTNWKSIGAAKAITSLSPRRPEILEWDWVVPATQATHSCLLVVMDSPGDTIPAANKILDVNTLVPQEKHVGLKNLHIIDAPPAPFWSEVSIFGRADGRDVLRLHGLPQGWSLGLLLPEKIVGKLKLNGLKRTALTKAQIKALTALLNREPTKSELNGFLALSEPKRGAELSQIPTLKGGFPLRLVWQASKTAVPGTLHLIQSAGETIIGGNTFVLRTTSS